VAVSDPAAYGEAFADVYDEWYAGVSDVDATVSFLGALAAGGPVLELGVGTGRLAVPLAARGIDIWGVDASPAMLRALAAKADAVRVRVHAVLGDIADIALESDGAPRFAVVFAAYNTLFNVVDVEGQARCVARAASLLAPGGRLVVEAFVPPDDLDERAGGVALRTLSADRVVLTATRHDHAAQLLSGQHVEFTTEPLGARARPWHIRYLSPDQLDTLAAAPGLRLERRDAGWQGEPFTAAATMHVSVYRSPL
jgi:SAM-dependent methyltransferase